MELLNDKSIGFIVLYDDCNENYVMMEINCDDTNKNYEIDWFYDVQTSNECDFEKNIKIFFSTLQKCKILCVDNTVYKYYDFEKKQYFEFDKNAKYYINDVKYTKIENFIRKISCSEHIYVMPFKNI